MEIILICCHCVCAESCKGDVLSVPESINVGPQEMCIDYSGGRKLFCKTSQEVFKHLFSDQNYSQCLSLLSLPTINLSIYIQQFQGQRILINFAVSAIGKFFGWWEFGHVSGVYPFFPRFKLGYG